jgi:hypothetical protein
MILDISFSFLSNPFILFALMTSPLLRICFCLSFFSTCQESRGGDAVIARSGNGEEGERGRTRTTRVEINEGWTYEGFENNW